MTAAMQMHELEVKLRTLSDHAWDQEVHWAHINGWRENFVGEYLSESDERLHGMLALSKFMYFSKRLVREMLRSLYRDYFEAPLLQRIRRNCGDTLDSSLIRRLYAQELAGTRFIGVGNPSESGAHLLYYFRQVNDLSKDLFVDFHGAFQPVVDASGKSISYEPRDRSIGRYVFFDDLVGSGSQVSEYLAGHLSKIRASFPTAEFRFVSLFSTSKGLERLNRRALFDGNATTLFELDDSYKAFEAGARYFRNPPDWFDAAGLRRMVSGYGEQLFPGRGLGYKDGQLLLAFSHNTPDNSPAVFWVEGAGRLWTPVFIRFNKNYEEVTNAP
jgi:hypothetical protein